MTEKKSSAAQEQSPAQPSSAMVLIKHWQRNLCFHWIQHKSRGCLHQRHTVTFNNFLFFKCFSSQTCSHTIWNEAIYNSTKLLLMPQLRTHHQGPQRLERRFTDDKGILLESKRMLRLCKPFCLHENNKAVMPSNYWNVVIPAVGKCWLQFVSKNKQVDRSNIHIKTLYMKSYSERIQELTNST